MSVMEVQALDRQLDSMVEPLLYVDQVETYLRLLAIDIDSETNERQPGFESRPGDMYPEVEATARRDVLGLMAAAVGLRSSVEREDDGSARTRPAEKDATTSVTMLDMLRGAASGNAEALAAATENISTMVREVTKKYQSVSKVTGHIDDEGHFWQYGQSSRHYLLNTFAFVEVNKTTKDEALGMLRFEEQVRQGVLRPGETYWEISLVPEGERQRLCEAGYFLESMSYVVRGLTLQEDGKNVDVEVAFVAGVDQEQVTAEVGDGMTEEEAVARQEHALILRHDIAVLEHLEESKRLNFNFDRSSNIQSFITSNGATPHGVVDIVRLCDDAASELLGKDVFFGVAQPREDYTLFPAKCQEYMSKFDGLVQDVLHDATTIVAQGEMSNPADIPSLLRRIVADYLTPRAVELRDFDLRVLGVSAAQLLFNARQAADGGDTEAAKSLVVQAKKVAAVDDCPSARKRAEQQDDSSDDDENDSSEESDEDCDIMTFCPHCSDLNYDGSPSSFRIRVKARIDQTETIHCGRCYAYAGPTGESEGTIKPLAMVWARKREAKKYMKALSADE
jgi:hypothetical protein